MLFGQIIAYAATLKNLNSTWVPTYGPETRGGTANCMVSISNGPIYSPVFNQCDDLIVFNAPSYNKFSAMIRSGGTIYYNSALIKELAPVDERQIGVDCNGVATSLANVKVLNIVMLGRYMKDLNLFGEAELELALLHFFGQEKVQPDSA